MISHFSDTFKILFSIRVSCYTPLVMMQCKQYVCQEMKDWDINGNTEKLYAVSETERKAWKHQEYAGNMGFYCSLCQRVDGSYWKARHIIPIYQKETEAGGQKILSLTLAKASAKLSQWLLPNLSVKKKKKKPASKNPSSSQILWVHSVFLQGFNGSNQSSCECGPDCLS